MASFKTLANGDDLQQKEYYKEIQDGFYERWTFTGASSKPAWAVAGGSTAAGDDIQAASFWSGLQDAVSDLITNLPAGVDFVKPSGSSPPTPGTFGSALNNISAVPVFANGGEVWRKVTADNWPGPQTSPRRWTGDGTQSAWPTSWDNQYLGFNYGTCQAGDLIGPWLIQDLTKALQFLRAFQIAIDREDAIDVYKAVIGTNERTQKGSHFDGGGYFISHFNTARDNHNADTTDPAPAEVAGPPLFQGRAYAQIKEQFGGNYQVHSFASLQQHGATGIDTSVDHRLTTFIALEDAYDGSGPDPNGDGYAAYGFAAGVTQGNFARVYTDGSWQNSATRVVSPMDQWDRDLDEATALADNWPDDGEQWFLGWETSTGGTPTEPLGVIEYQFGYE